MSTSSIIIINLREEDVPGEKLSKPPGECSVVELQSAMAEKNLRGKTT